ncbi:MAG: shikimate kinase AroK [Wenzhouxiangellaceae bacterium]
MKHNVFLIGPMGSGKTSLGRRVAPRLGLQFVDLDEELERRLGVEVSVVFEIEGEAGFRQREHDLLAEIATRDHLLVATGGGVVLDPANREILKRNGTVVWLKTTVDQQLKRLKRDRRRPLLMTPDRRERLLKLAEQRDPVYAALADIVFESRDRPMPVMADTLYRFLKSELRWQHPEAQ